MRADARRYHYIYKITRFDGKYYIGMHSTDDLEDGYFGSGKLITRSIKKYGRDKHLKEILEFLDSRILLKEKERELVNEEIVDDPFCMNLQLGGGGGFINEEHANKFHRAGQKAMMEKVYSDPEKLKKRGAKFSETFKTRVAAGDIKLAGGFIGLKHSEETKQKMRKSKNVGNANANFGKRNALINDGEMNKRIPLDQLESYLLQGWKKGMK